MERVYIAILIIYAAANLDLHECKSNSTSHARGSSKTLLIKWAGQCPGKTNMTHHIENVTIQQQSKFNYIMNGEMVFDTDLDTTATKIVIQLNKCDNANFNADSCHPLMNDILVKDICKFIATDGTIFSMFIAKLEKKLTCPFKKGSLFLTVPVNLEFMKILTVSSSSLYFEMNFKGYTDKKLTICVAIHLIIKLKHN